MFKCFREDVLIKMQTPAIVQNNRFCCNYSRREQRQSAAVWGSYEVACCCHSAVDGCSSAKHTSHFLTAPDNHFVLTHTPDAHVSVPVPSPTSCICFISPGGRSVVHINTTRSHVHMLACGYSSDLVWLTGRPLSQTGSHAVFADISAGHEQ